MSRSSSEGSKTGSVTLGKLIRDRRHQLQMSRQDLADATGVPYSTIAQIETAYRGVSPSRLGIIARVLGLDPKELYDVLAGETPPPSSGSARQGTSRRSVPDVTWHKNPAYGMSTEFLASAPPAASGEVRLGGMSEADVVDQAADLLSQLPPAKRLDALGRLQKQVLSGLLQEEVRRAREADD